MIWTIVVNVIPVVLRSTNTQPIRDSYVDLGYLGNLHKYFYLLQMSECLEKVFANNRFLVGFYEKKEPYGLFRMVVVQVHWYIKATTTSHFSPVFSLSLMFTLSHFRCESTSHWCYLLEFNDRAIFSRVSHCCSAIKSAVVFTHTAVAVTIS